VLVYPDQFNGWFTRARRVKSAAQRGKPAINHAYRAFIENKRYGEEQRGLDGVVNRNAGFVYQTDAF
jgi:hypothetical protein